MSDILKMVVNKPEIIAVLITLLIALVNYLRLRRNKELLKMKEERDEAYRQLILLRRVEEEYVKSFQFTEPNLKRTIREIAMLETGIALVQKLNPSYLRYKLNQKN